MYNEKKHNTVCQFVVYRFPYHFIRWALLRLRLNACTNLYISGEKTHIGICTGIHKYLDLFLFFFAAQSLVCKAFIGNIWFLLYTHLAAAAVFCDFVYIFLLCHVLGSQIRSLITSNARAYYVFFLFSEILKKKKFSPYFCFVSAVDPFRVCVCECCACFHFRFRIFQCPAASLLFDLTNASARTQMNNSLFFLLCNVCVRLLLAVVMVYPQKKKKNIRSLFFCIICKLCIIQFFLALAPAAIYVLHTHMHAQSYNEMHKSMHIYSFSFANMFLLHRRTLRAQKKPIIKFTLTLTHIVTHCSR